MLSDRLSSILEAAIAEFIETGEPVSSGGLFRHNKFGVKPATIRNELSALTEAGYLEQPHISGGRVPTDRGYEFYVERRMGSLIGPSLAAVSRIIELIEADLQENEWEDFISDVSERLGVLSVGYDPREEWVCKVGLHELVTDVGAEDPRDILAVVDDFEAMDERLTKLAKHLGGGKPMVFIGESPITESPKLSVIADRYRVDGKDLILAAVGPKRMDYARNIGFFKRLREAIEN